MTGTAQTSCLRQNQNSNPTEGGLTLPEVHKSVFGNESTHTDRGIDERLVFFGDWFLKQDAFRSMLEKLQVHSSERSYVAFVRRSTGQGYGSYLVQMRIVTRAALHEIFNVAEDFLRESLPAQNVPVAEVLWAFVEDQINRWNPILGHVPGDIVWKLFHGTDDVREGLVFFRFMTSLLYLFGIYPSLESGKAEMFHFSGK